MAPNQCGSGMFRRLRPVAFFGASGIGPRGATTWPGDPSAVRFGRAGAGVDPRGEGPDPPGELR